MKKKRGKADRRLWELAVHEAGHVLGNRLSGAQILKATIRSNGSVRWRMMRGLVGWTDSAVTSLLGHAAELEFGFDNRLSIDSLDYRKALRSVKGSVKGSVKATRLAQKDWKPEFDRLRCKARQLAKKHRAYIERVALLLMEHGTLTDEEIPKVRQQRRNNGRT